jgi:hypothetical protein
LAALSYEIALPLTWQQIAVCLAISLSEEMPSLLLPHPIAHVKSSGQQKIKGIRSSNAMQAKTKSIFQMF